MRIISSRSPEFIAKVLALTLLAPAALSAQDIDVARMDQIVQSHVTAKQFMGAVLVARNGQVLVDKGYGYADLEWQIPDTPDTKFRLGCFRIRGGPPAISKHVEEERVILTPSEHETLSSAYADSSTE